MIKKIKKTYSLLIIFLIITTLLILVIKYKDDSKIICAITGGNIEKIIYRKHSCLICPAFENGYYYQCNGGLFNLL